MRNMVSGGGADCSMFCYRSGGRQTLFRSNAGLSFLRKEWMWVGRES